MAVRQLTPEEEAKPYAKYYHRPLTPPDPDLIAQIQPDVADRSGPGAAAGAHQRPARPGLPRGRDRLVRHAQRQRLPGRAQPDAGRHRRDARLVVLVALDGRHALRPVVSAGPLRHLHQQEEPREAQRSERAGQGEDLRPHRPRGRGHRHGRGGHLHQLLRARADGLRHEPLPRSERRGRVRRLRLRPGAGRQAERHPGARHHVPLHPRDRRRRSSSARASGWATSSSTASPVLAIPPGESVPAEVPYGLADHNVREYCNLKSLLPEIWAEFKDADPAL